MPLRGFQQISGACSWAGLLSGRSEVRIPSWTPEITGIPLEIAIDFSKMEFLFYVLKSPLTEETMAASAKNISKIQRPG